MDELKLGIECLNESDISEFDLRDPSPAQSVVSAAQIDTPISEGAATFLPVTEPSRISTKRLSFDGKTTSSHKSSFGNLPRPSSVEITSNGEVTTRVTRKGRLSMSITGGVDSAIALPSKESGSTISTKCELSNIIEAPLK